jgi:hypothetical protein
LFFVPRIFLSLYSLLFLLFLAEHYNNSIKENEMGRACRKHGREGKLIQGLTAKTCSKETTWKTWE